MRNEIINENDVIIDQLSEEMKFLMDLLRAEWAKSKESKRFVRIRIEEAPDICWLLDAELQEKLGVNLDKLSFAAAVEHTKDCAVLFRIIKKIKLAERRCNERREGAHITVPVDAEEWKLYREFAR